MISPENKTSNVKTFYRIKTVFKTVFKTDVKDYLQDLDLQEKEEIFDNNKIDHFFLRFSVFELRIRDDKIEQVRNC